MWQEQKFSLSCALVCWVLTLPISENWQWWWLKLIKWCVRFLLSKAHFFSPCYIWSEWLYYGLSWQGMLGHVLCCPGTAMQQQKYLGNWEECRPLPLPPICKWVHRMNNLTAPTHSPGTADCLPCLWAKKSAANLSWMLSWWFISSETPVFPLPVAWLFQRTQLSSPSLPRQAVMHPWVWGWESWWLMGYSVKHPAHLALFRRESHTSSLNDQNMPEFAQFSSRLPCYH